MKLGRAGLGSLILASLIFAGGLTAFADGEGLSSIFTLDTRGDGWTYSALFTLDTRDPDQGTSSGLFTLDTRGGLLPQTSVFTLDTRGLELTYAPENLTVVAEQMTRARVAWQYFGTPLGFQIQRRDPLGDWASMPVSGGLTRSLTDTTVWPGHFYEYRVAAVLTTGVSEYSETAYIQMPALPNAPEALEATVNATGQVDLAWQDLSKDEDGFELWRRTGLDGIWGLTLQEGADETNALDTAVASDTAYAYKVRAFNVWGYSAFSQEASVVTPDSGGGCGFMLRVDDSSLRLDGVAMHPLGINVAESRALLEGNLLTWIRSPRGNPHPVRVVLGFRNDQGQAVGAPVELVDFYCVPGCPGISVEALIPPSFRAPEGGTNTLWLEMVMAQRDPIEAFMTQRHSQENPMRKKLFDVALRPNELAEARVRVLDGSTTVGETIEVPVQLISDGGELEVAFSIAFDTGISWDGAELGEDALHALIQTSVVLSNAVGIAVSMPLENPLEEGSKQLLTLRFVADQAGEYALQIQDEPIERAITCDVSAPSSITWDDGLLRVSAAGWEGDVSPEPNGDGVVDKQDFRLAKQYAMGCLELPTDPWAFQRLDCAPSDTCGDGIVDMADVVTIQHMANGQLELSSACGPTGVVEQAPSDAMVTSREASPRSLLLTAPEEIQRGESFWVSLDLTAQGDEHGFSASLAYDPDVLAYQDMRITGVATNGDFLPNLDDVPLGSIAFGVTLRSNDLYSAGSQTVLEIQFTALEGLGTNITTMDVTSSPAECLAVGLDSGSLELTPSGSDIIVFDLVFPSAPLPPESGQAVALAMDQIQVSWASVSWATGYRVRRKLEGESVWTSLEDCEATRTVITDDGLSPDTLCHYLITSLNPQGEESSAIRVEARTWTALEEWRDTWFSDIENAGPAADDADPDGDALPNLMEYQLGTDPLSVTELPYSLDLEEVFSGSQSLTVSYAVSTGSPGLISFEFTGDLLRFDLWSSQGLAPVSLRTSSESDQIKLRLPDDVLSNGKIFLRMKTE